MLSLFLRVTIQLKTKCRITFSLIFCFFSGQKVYSHEVGDNKSLCSPYFFFAWHLFFGFWGPLGLLQQVLFASRSSTFLLHKLVKKTLHLLVQKTSAQWAELHFNNPSSHLKVTLPLDSNPSHSSHPGHPTYFKATFIILAAPNLSKHYKREQSQQRPSCSRLKIYFLKLYAPENV